MYVNNPQLGGQMCGKTSGLVCAGSWSLAGWRVCTASVPASVLALMWGQGFHDGKNPVKLGFFYGLSGRQKVSWQI